MISLKFRIGIFLLSFIHIPRIAKCFCTDFKTHPFVMKEIPWKMEIIIGFVFAFLGLRLSYFVKSTKLSTLNFEPTYNLTIHYQGLEGNNSEISPIYPTSTVAMEIETDIPSFQNNFQTCPLHCSCEYSSNNNNNHSNHNNNNNNNSDSDDRTVTNSTTTTTRHSQMRFYRSQASLARSYEFHLKVSCRYSGFDVPPLSIPLESTHIDLTGNRLLSGSLALLRDCRSLKHLVISECHVRNVADMILGGHDWFLTLSSLDVSRNRIIYLHNSSFLKTPFLEFLNLSHNRIELIHKEAFIFLDNLSVLDLSGNRLSSFSDSSWCYYIRESLIFLDLSSNNIHTISNVPLKLLQKLAHLNLSSNHIKHLQADTFINSGNLERLLMADNMIENLPTLDERLERLKYLDLNGNNLPVLARNSFSNLPSLETILLERNPSMLVVEEASFSNMSLLRTVQLNDNNNLAYIDRHAFVNITNLRTLEIRAGSLETLEENVLVSLPCLENIDISSNPLKCDCVLNWLARQSTDEKNYSSQNNNSVTLKMPDNDSNKTITLHNYINTSCLTLNNQNNTCEPRILSKLFSKEVLVKMADPLLAYCVAVGNPSPTSYWSRLKNHKTYDEVRRFNCIRILFLFLYFKNYFSGISRIKSARQYDLSFESKVISNTNGICRTFPQIYRKMEIRFQEHFIIIINIIINYCYYYFFIFYYY